jgi:hypothetical protein
MSSSAYYNLDIDRLLELERRYEAAHPEDKNEEIPSTDFYGTFKGSEAAGDAICRLFGSMDRAIRVMNFNGYDVLKILEERSRDGLT